MSKRTAQPKVQRLIQRVRRNSDGRANVKVRTLLSAFGYSRRTDDVVQCIRQELAGEGITVDFSVSSPATLDGWIELVTEPASLQSGRPASPVDVPPQIEAPAAHPPVAANGPRSLSPADTARPASQASGDMTPPTRLLDSSAVPAAPEPPRSVAARLFRAAVRLFLEDPPTTLGMAQNSDQDVRPSAGVERPPASKQAGFEPNASAPPVRALVDGELPVVAPSKTAQSQAVGRRPPAAPAITPELSCVAEQTICATVFVDVDAGHGSGFIVHPDGLVVTACHVLDSPAGLAVRATIKLHDGRESTASLIRAHRALDFALLWLDTPGKYPVLTIGDASKTRYAETVLAVGHPGVGGARRALRNTVSTGVVANPACSERGVDWIQMTTDIDPGNSGGPLVNRFGDVVGINCWKFTSVDAAKMALPIDYLDEDIAAATERGRDGSAAGRVCSMCGWFEPDPDDWFCVTCGAPQSAEPVAG